MSTRDRPLVKGLRRVEGVSKFKGKADPHLPPTETVGDHGTRSPDLSIVQEGSKVWIPRVLKHRRRTRFQIATLCQGGDGGPTVAEERPLVPPVR